MIRLLLAATALLAALGGTALAQTVPCPNPNDDCGTRVVDVPPGQFPRIDFRAFAGIVGSQGQDSTVGRTITLQWTRDLALEQQLVRDTVGGGFGGYNIYRVYTSPDTCELELIRRFVYKDSLLWHFPDTQRVVRFVDPDSAGRLVKICRPDPATGAPCPRPGDSTYVLMPPPPPPDGFPTYYAIVYAANPALVNRGFENKFVPDSTDAYARCTTPGNKTTCCNLNHLALNLMTDPVFTSGPVQTNLERVTVVPNPYRGSEAWDPEGTNRIEFRGLPAKAEISVYTAAGDLVRVVQHDNTASGSQGWDLKNADGRDVASGIYIYRVTSPPTDENPQGFQFMSTFVVIR